jgi:hypothetical protein
MAEASKRPAVMADGTPCKNTQRPYRAFQQSKKLGDQCRQKYNQTTLQREVYSGQVDDADTWLSLA